MSKFSIGIDFGTLSARALLVDLGSGEEIALSEYKYPHSVMDTSLYDGTKLSGDWALQHPQDYIDALKITVREAVGKAGVSVGDIIGVGVDFTSCTVIPVDEAWRPLCFNERYINEPHAYAKLWKHHAAQPEADRINEIAMKNGYEALL